MTSTNLHPIDLARSSGGKILDRWMEDLDPNAVMLLCKCQDKYDKPSALSVLYDPDRCYFQIAVF